MSQSVRDPRTGIVRVSLREIDPEDYDPPADLVLPGVPNVDPDRPGPRVVIDFAVQGTVIQDSAGSPRRPAIQMTWDWDQPDARGIRYEIRPQGQTALASRGSVHGIQAGSHIVSEGILPLQTYEVRALPIMDRQTAWTPWMLATTPDVRLSWGDLDENIHVIWEDILSDLDDVKGALDGIEGNIQTDLDGIRGQIADVRDDLATQVGVLEQDVADALIEAKAYTDTGITNEQITRQGQHDSLVARIDELTAALVSDQLLTNGTFVDGADGFQEWTRVGTVTRVSKYEAAPAPLRATMPAPFCATIAGDGGTSQLRQMTQSFEVTPEDMFQVRFAAGANGGREMRVRCRWFDASDVEISANNQSVVIEGGNIWRRYAVRLDPPDTVRRAEVIFSNITSGVAATYVTNFEATTVNASVEARIAELEIAVADDKQALALYKQTVSTRFGTNETNLQTEITNRSNAVSAVNDRVDTLSSQTATNTAKIATVETTITTMEQTIASVEESTEAIFGASELIRDPVFAKGISRWPSGNLGSVNDVAAKNPAATSAFLKLMPALKALRINPGQGTGVTRRTDYIESIKEGDVLDMSFDYARLTTSPVPRLLVQFWNADKATIGTAFGLLGDQAAVGRWLTATRGEITAPAGTAFVTAAINNSVDGTTTTFVTNISVKKRVGYDSLSDAAIKQTQVAVADANTALGILDQRVTANYNTLDGRVQANAAAIDQRYTKAEADAATAAAIVGVNTRVNRLYAGGKLRMTSQTTPNGAVARVGIHAEAGEGDNSHSAGMYLVAESGGATSVTFEADRFAVVAPGAGPNAARTVPFAIVNGQVILREAIIGEATIGSLNVKKGAITQLFTAFNDSFSPGGTLSNAAVVPVNMAYPGSIIFGVYCRTSYISTTPGNILVRVTVNGEVVPGSDRTYTTEGAGASGITTHYEFSRGIQCAPGSYVIRLQVRSSTVFRDCQIYALRAYEGGN